MDYRAAYSRGKESETWDRLCDLDNSRDSRDSDTARSIAREAMRRVRHNLELLIPRWKIAGYRFGYAWAGRWAADEVKKAPPLLAQPDHVTLAALSRFEETIGPLPIALRAFYEVVGAVNFVGEVAAGWPNREILDPLQVEDFVPQLPGLLQGETDQVVICPDHLHKYFVSGVDALAVRVPSTDFDPVLLFEDGELEMDGRSLTFGRYLRYVILKRGGIGLIAGYNDDAPDASLIASLTCGLQPF